MTATTRSVMRISATIVSMAMISMALLPAVSAGSEMSPEIADAIGDVSPAVFASNETIDNATITALYQNETTYDVVKAWVGVETMHDFWLFIKVVNLPDGWNALGAPPAQSPFGSNLSHAGTSLVANFTIGGLTYEAVAKLAMPSAGKLLDNYTLWHNGARGDISGTYNTTEDWVAMKLPKSAFPGLVDGSKLTQFWVQGRFANMSMDYAPDARNSVGGTPDPVSLLASIQAGALVTPNYGLDYSFGQYYHPPGSNGGGGNWPSVPGIQLASLSDDQMNVEPGESVLYELRIANTGTASDTVYFVLNSAKSGWSHQLSESSLTLPAGASKLVYLTVSAAETATGALDSKISASSSLGGEDSLMVSTIAKGADMPDDGATDDDEPMPTQADGGSPGFEIVGLLAAAAVAVIALRRRH